MKVYHGTSKNNSKLIQQQGIKINSDVMNIDNQGYFTMIDAFFVTPNKDIAHIYECDNSKDGALIIELELDNNSKIFDLTLAENQKIIINFLENNCQSLNDYLVLNNYDGCKQYHKNDFGSKRLEYAITNLNKLQITKIPKRKTAFMSLYNEAIQADINTKDFI